MRAGIPARLERLRARHAPLVTEGPWMRELFPQQRAFVDDPARMKAALCTRRAGKTWSAAAHLLETAHKVKGSTSVYIGLTRASAKRLMWDELIRANERIRLGMTFNHSELVCRLPNGSIIFLVGADDAATIERLRGGKYALVVIDEAASFRPSVLEALVREIVRPALIDLRGTLCLMGTPGAACVGMFYRATTDAQSPFALHHWSVLDNPHIPHAAEEIATEMKANGWTDQHPIYLREWRGQWVRDSGSLVYQYARERNAIARFAHDPECRAKGVRFGLGLDFGFTDSTAFAIMAWWDDKPETCLVRSYQRPGMIPSAVAAETMGLNAVYQFDAIVGDVGGLGKGYAEEMRQRYSIPVKPAQKRDKVGYISLMNGDLRSGLLTVVENDNAQCIEDWTILPWAPRPKNVPAPKPGEDDAWRAEEDPRFDNHIPDAALYIWREAKGWAHVRAPEPESDDDKDLRETLEADERAASEDWWDRAG